MTSAISKFCNFWRYAAEEKTRGLHRTDIDALGSQTKTIARFARSLVPKPTTGSILDAKVIVLRVNPGFAGSEPVIEEDGTVAARLWDNLKQTTSNPFLDGSLPQHPGSAYDAKPAQFGWHADRLAAAKKCTRDQAAKMLAEKVAVLQLLPYHSAKSSQYPAAAWNLPSVRLARCAAQELSQSKLVLMTRGLKRWGSDGNFTVNGLNFVRSASLSAHSDCGRALADWLKQEFSLVGA